MADGMRIAIMGAGGVGGYVGARLQEAGEQVVFVARGAHLAALQRDGLRVRSPAGDLHLRSVRASDDPAQLGVADVVLFTVKLWDTEAAARAMAPLLAAGTRVVTLQNGIDSVGLIAREVPRERVVGGAIYVSTVIAEPGVITNLGGLHRMVVDGAGGDPAIAALVEACGRATGLEAVTTETIGLTLWEKFITLAALSGATTLLRAPMGPILANDETRAFLRQLIDEGAALAAATGNAQPDGLVEGALARIGSMPPGFRASMAEDLERGKPLELAWLSGRMHDLGLEHGVATPAHTAVYRGLILHADGPLGCGR